MSKALVLKGVAQWAKVFEENRDMKGYEDVYKSCNGAYTINLVMDPEEYQKLKDAGSAKEGTVTEEGVSVKLVRKHSIFSTKDGSEIPELGGAPRVVTSDNEAWDIDTMGEIGNGSEVEVGIVIYPAKRANGTRLESVRVNKLVVYEGDPSKDLPF